MVLNLPYRCYWLFLQSKALLLKTFKKILKWVLFSLLFLIIAGWIFINTDRGQNMIARAVTNRLSRELKTKININHVSFSLFNKMNLEGVLIEDQKNDTLLSAGNMQVRVTDWFFFKDKIVLHYIELADAVIYINRADSVWNYQYLVDYFSGGSSTTSKKKGVELDFIFRSLVTVPRLVRIVPNVTKSFIKPVKLPLKSK